MKRIMKFKQQVLKKWNNIFEKKSCCFMQISSLLSSLVLIFRNEEKLVALLVYSSFSRVATSMLPKNSVFTSTGS